MNKTKKILSVIITFILLISFTTIPINASAKEILATDEFFPTESKVFENNHINVVDTMISLSCEDFNIIFENTSLKKATSNNNLVSSKLIAEYIFSNLPEDEKDLFLTKAKGKQVIIEYDGLFTTVKYVEEEPLVNVALQSRAPYDPVYITKESTVDKYLLIAGAAASFTFSSQYTMYFDNLGMINNVCRQGFQYNYVDSNPIGSYKKLSHSYSLSYNNSIPSTTATIEGYVPNTSYKDTFTMTNQN